MMINDINFRKIKLEKYLPFLQYIYFSWNVENLYCTVRKGTGISLTAIPLTHNDTSEHSHPKRMQKSTYLPRLVSVELSSSKKNLKF